MGRHAPRKSDASPVVARSAPAFLWPLAVTTLAVLLVLPSLGVGLEADDYFHRVWLLALPELPDLTGPAWDLFGFSYGDRARVQRLMDRGIAPWWTLPELKLAFCRPLASLTHWLDYALWPDTPALMHAHNLVWFALLVGGAAVVYRRIFGATLVAGLAALLFALDDAHATPAGWIGGRNTLIAAAIGVWCIAVHDRWRRANWRPGMVVGPLLLLASLLSAEAGVATMAYIVPHALFLDRGPVRRRLLSLAPYVCVVIAWRVVWAALGYGVHGAGAYVDPAASPLRFAGALIEVGPVLLLAQWAFPPSDLYALYDAFWPGTARLVWLAAVAFLTLIAFVLAKRLRRERETAFWTSGMLLALAPVCATVDFPMDRLLLFVGLGACGLLANFLAAVWSARRATAAGTARPRLWTASLALAVFFVLVHLVVSPVALVVRAAAPAGPHEFTSQFYVSLPDDVVRGADTIVVVNAPSGGMVTMFPVMQAATGKPVPQRMRMLGPSLSALTITREGDRTLRIRPDDGFMAWTYDRLVRGLDHPFTAGERVELAGMHVQVTDITGDGRPAEALFVFDVELDHAALLWLQWRDGRFVPFTLPATGETVRIPRAKPHFGF